MADPRLDPNPKCKICRSPTYVAFALPVSKRAGEPMPDLPDDCPYFQCSSCYFCFSTHIDNQSHVALYDDYWANHSGDQYVGVHEPLRLVLLANSLVKRAPDSLDVLDFGCGSGGFVEVCRRSLQLNAWGTDIVSPKFAKDFFLPTVDRKFDIIVSCEVVEHLPAPRQIFEQLRSWLKPGGALAFQTAQYDPKGEKRDWWYVGPGNGHISLYSREALDHLFKDIGGKERVMWRNYPGVQAWQFD